MLERSNPLFALTRIMGASNLEEWSMIWIMLILFPHTSNIRIKGRRTTMRHVSRTHRVALDWLFDRINLDPKIQIKYIDTKNQLADMLTKGNFTRDEWNHLLCLFNISPCQFCSLHRCNGKTSSTRISLNVVEIGQYFMTKDTEDTHISQIQ